MPIPPIVLSMLICDAVHRDAETGRFYLIGSFAGRRFDSFPAVLRDVHLFLSLIEVNGMFDLRVRIIDVNEENDPIFETGGRLQGSDPLAVFEFNFPLPNVQFPQSGEFRLQLFINGEILAEKKLMIRKRDSEFIDE